MFASLVNDFRERKKAIHNFVGMYVSDNMFTYEPQFQMFINNWLNKLCYYYYYFYWKSTLQGKSMQYDNKLREVTCGFFFTYACINISIFELVWKNIWWSHECGIKAYVNVSDVNIWWSSMVISTKKQKKCIENHF